MSTERGAAAHDERARILYVSTVDIVVRMMLPQLDALRAAGFTVEIACRLTRHGDEMAAHADAVHEIPFRRSPIHPQNLAATARLVRLVRERRYAIVHSHTPVGGVAGRLAATLARRGPAATPLRVYTAHGFHFHAQGGAAGNLLYRGIETWAGRQLSDAVLTINREDYEAARRYRLVSPPGRVFLTGGVGVSTERFDPARGTPEERAAVRDEIGAAPDTPVLTFVGEMIPRKRHPDALEAFARIRRARPDALLVLVGEGVLAGPVRRLAEQRGVADGCRFLGFRRDIPAILAATDVFLFPSAQEGLPCAVQEALAMEVPVVGAAVRGTRDLVRSDCGRLVPLGDTAGLADACLELLECSPEVRRQMGRAGRERMAAEYGRAACVAQWMRIYSDLLAERGVPLPPGRAADVAWTPEGSAAETPVALAAGVGEQRR